MTKQAQKGWEGREDSVLLLGVCATAAAVVATICGAGPVPLALGLFLLGCGFVLVKGRNVRARQSQEEK